MANEELTIAKEKARLTVIGNSYPDTLTDSGLGLDLSQIIFDILIDLGLDLPDIDPDDLDDITVIIGIDPDTEIVTLEYPDPDFDPDIDPDDLPDILDYPLPDLDWDDFIDNLEDLGIDPNTLKDLSFTGLNDLGIPTLVSLDEDFNIQEDELPASIEIVTMPNKLEYQDGERIDLTGIVVTAKKADGSTWTSAKYPNGHIPLGELIVDPMVVSGSENFVNLNGRYNIDNPNGDILTGLVPVNTFVGYEQHGVGSRYPANIINTYRILPDNGAILLFCHFDKRPYSGEEHLYGNFSLLIATDTNPAYHEHYEYNSNVIDKDYSISQSYTSDGKTVYYSTRGTFGYFFLDLNVVGNYLPIRTSSDITVNEAGNAALAWELIYGDKCKGNDIKISWARPSDGEMLSASFIITIDDNSSGNGGR